MPGVLATAGAAPRGGRAAPRARHWHARGRQRRSRAAGRRGREARLLAVGQHQVGAERLEQDAALDGHAVRHREHQLVTARRCDEREAYASVAAGRLHLQQRFTNFLFFTRLNIQVLERHEVQATG